MTINRCETALRARRLTVFCAAMGLTSIIGIATPSSAHASGETAFLTGVGAGCVDGDLIFDVATVTAEPDYDREENGQHFIRFDPVARGLDTDRDNVFEFCTVSIPSGVTLELKGPKLQMASVYFLASGSVSIDGVIDLRGADGGAAGVETTSPAIPGPGGWPGGIGALPGDPLRAGGGPGGASAGTNPNLYHGENTANAFLLPLIGGSGGSGDNAVGASGGGAGGGALLIASDVSIGITGLIDVGGGNESGYVSGIGAGGSVRLVAPSVTGAGAIDGRSYWASGSSAYGRVRIETNTPTAEQTIVIRDANISRASLSPATVIRPLGPPRLVWVEKVDGIPLGSSTAPDAGYLAPDVSIDTDQTVPILVRATGMPAPLPAGAQGTLHVYNETLAHEEVEVVFDAYNPDAAPCGGADRAPLPAGLPAQLQVHEACVDVTFPHGFSRVLVFFTWSDPS